MYEPTWKKYEKDIKSDDLSLQIKATDAFIDTREKETAISKKAKDWEDSRKEELVKNKKYYVQSKREEDKLADPSQKIINEIRDGGVHENRLIPMRGYVLIRVIKEEPQTVGGIILAETGIEEPNTAEVLEIGGDLILDKNTIPTPVKPGSRILFKKFAGMTITLMGEPLRIIQFSDILGELA